jgi:APA family basic amino acid/polyamine antiporter
VVAVVLLLVLGADGTARSAAPLFAAVESGSWSWAGPVVRVGAAAAALGALLALIAGIGRTGLAMARHGDLPRWLAAVHPRYRVPHRAEVVLAGVVAALVLTVDLRGAIGFSSFGVLLYYLVANAAAFTQPPGRRRWPRGVQVLGAVGCLLLMATLPWQSVAAGLGVLAAGVAYRLLRLRRQRG